MSLLDRQILKAKDNFNYFFMIMISKILRLLVILALILLISQIINITFIYQMVVILILLSFYKIFQIIKYYTYILEDIRSTLPHENIYYVIDFSLMKKIIFKKSENYGR